MCCNRERRITGFRTKRSGFSLMEMLAVIAIIGLLVGAVAVGVQGHMARARIGVAKMEITKIVDALEAYSADKTRYPTQEEGLVQLSGTSGKKEDEYINKSDFNDPWGSPYEYLVPGSNQEPFEVISAGPDRQFETEDDLSNLTLGNDE